MRSRTVGDRTALLTKIIALRARTVENGCTAAEVLTSQEVAARLMGAHGVSPDELAAAEVPSTAGRYARRGKHNASGPRTKADWARHYAAVRGRLTAGPIALPPGEPVTRPVPILAERVVRPAAIQHAAHVAAFRFWGRLPRINRLDAVIAVAADHFGVPRDRLVGPGRAADILLPRHVAMFVARQFTGASLPSIGQRFGKRDHTTVLHAVQKIRAGRRARPAIASAVSLIEARLRDAGVAEGTNR